MNVVRIFSLTLRGSHGYVEFYDQDHCSYPTVDGRGRRFSSSVSLGHVFNSRSSDAIIHARITNDERPLRRVIKKFHNYASVAHEPIVPGGAGVNRTTVEDAREAFIVELESFHLSLKKSVMICEAEARQVEEYLREKQRIGKCTIPHTSEPLMTILSSDDEHGKLVGQIDQLKTALEHEQTIRKRKIEYDLIAEKVNALPNREELER